MSAPTGMEDSLVLSACGTETLIDKQSSVRNTLAGIAPEGYRSFFPLNKSGKLVKLKERDNVAESVLVKRLMRR